MSDRAEPVLAAALERLVTNGTLTRAQAEAVRTDFQADLRSDLQRRPDQRSDDSSSWTPVLAEVGGYLGAAFVVAAAAALVGPNWDNFSQLVRIAVLAVPAVLLLIAAAIATTALPGGWSFRAATAGNHDVEGHQDGPQPAATVRRLIGALVLAAGGLLAGAAAVISGDTGADHWVPLVALAVWGLGYALFRGIPLHLGAAVALSWTVMTMLDRDLDATFPLAGLVLVLAAVGWAALSRYHLIVEQPLAIAVAGVMAFAGGEYVAVSDYEGLGYVLLGLLAGIGLAGYVRTRHLSALGVGAASLAVVVPQVVIDYTEGSLGAAGGLLVSGLSIVAVSVLVARLRRTGSGPTQLV